MTGTIAIPLEGESDPPFNSISGQYQDWGQCRVSEGLKVYPKFNKNFLEVFAAW
jgi:hypothetical protein